MKNLSLAALAIGIIGAVSAFKSHKKQQSVNTVVIEAAEIVQQAKELPRDTVYQIVYRTKHIYLPATREAPTGRFLDTSMLSIPAVDRFYGTKFQDTLETIALEDWIKPPKDFLYKDENIFISGKVLSTGVTFDSISLPAKLSFSPAWGRKVAEVSIVTANPYITGLSPNKIKFKIKDKTCLFQ